MSYLVANPEDRSSRHEAHFVSHTDRDAADMTDNNGSSYFLLQMFLLTCKNHNFESY